MSDIETALAAREMTWLERQVSRFKRWLPRLRRKLPYLVWYGDEMDVTVRFLTDRLPEGLSIDQAFQVLSGGDLRLIENALHQVGIGFDTGMGFEGRDWEWDYSLSGPISIAFRGRAARPEARKARPRPRLVVSNDAA